MKRQTEEFYVEKYTLPVCPFPWLIVLISWPLMTIPPPNPLEITSRKLPKCKLVSTRVLKY